MHSVSIIGVGRVGGAIAIALSKKNYEIRNFFVRNPANALHVIDKILPKPEIVSENLFNLITEDIVFITTQDPLIERVASDLSDAISDIESIIFHTSGSLSSDTLADLSRKGHKVGSIHPLVSVSDSFAGAENFKNAYFCVEGDEEAIGVAKKLVRDLGGIPFSMDTQYKSLYHAAAVTASGHLVALEEMAISMLSKTGIAAEDAKKILIPLIESTVENLAKYSTADSLTGTFARADVETLKRHLKTLKKNASRDELSIYLALGKKSLELARNQILDKPRVAEMMHILELSENELQSGSNS